MNKKIILMACFLVGLILSASAGPLYDAAFLGDTDTINRLLDDGAEIDARDERGYTPLMQAALGTMQFRYSPAKHERCMEAVKLLLIRGANAKLCTPDGHDALNIANTIKIGQKNDAIDILKDYMANPTCWLIAQLKNAPLARLLGKQELNNGKYVEALTDAIITAKNKQLPDFLATANSDQKVDLLTAVEKQIARATAGIDEVNAEAGTAVSKGQDPAPIRKRVGQIKAYINVLNEIKAILEQS
jgi:ankyrin repeat protein